MLSENNVDIFIDENYNYTFVSSETLEMRFPVEKTSSDKIVRERPSEPLIERSPEEIAKLYEHPFFL